MNQVIQVYVYTRTNSQLNTLMIICIGKHTLSEQIAHSTVDFHLKEISEFLRSSVMNKNFTLQLPLNQF